MKSGSAFKLESNIEKQDQEISVNDLCDAFSLCHRRAAFVLSQD